MIYIVRHGQTDWNVQKKVMGRCDEPLNEKGKQQAEETKDSLKEMNLDLIICSPLKRAKQTAEIINRDRNISIIYDDRIIERDWGMCEGAHIEEVDTVKCWNFHINTDNNKIERVQDLLARVSEFLEDIKVKYKDKNVLVVAHSAVLRAIHYCLHPIPEDGDMSKLEIPNLRIVEYEI